MRSKKQKSSDLPQDFLDMLGLLGSCGVEYLLVGGLALAAHGEPRATKDMDLWVNPTPRNATRLFRALAEFGAPPLGATEADFSSPGTFLQLGLPPVRIDLLTVIEGVSFEDAWPRRLEASLGGLTVPVLSRPDLVKNKLAAGRPQDLLDVERLRAASAERKRAKSVKKRRGT